MIYESKKYKITGRGMYVCFASTVSIINMMVFYLFIQHSLSLQEDTLNSDFMHI